VVQKTVRVNRVSQPSSLEFVNYSVAVDMIWNNSVELDDVRTLHLFIAFQ